MVLQPFRTNDDLALERQLRRRQRQRLTRGGFVDAVHFEHHAARLDDADPTFGSALTVTHTRFERLLADRLVREHADPHLARALDVARDGDTARLDLAL